MFGPALSLALAPAVWIGDRVNRTGWWDSPAARVPPSFYLDGALADRLAGREPPRSGERALRLLVTPANLLVSAAGAAVFHRLAARVTGSPGAALAVAILYAFGTPVVSYAGTLFSEPLTTLFVLASFLMLFTRGSAPNPAKGSSTLWNPGFQKLLSGLALGAAATAHLSALLFAPFLALAAGYPPDGLGRFSPRRARPFLLGLLPLLLLLGSYNLTRFGSPLETGRGVDENFLYAYWIPLGRGLYGLLLSPGKGLLLYVPALFAALAAWPAFHREHPLLSRTLYASALVRLLFIGARSDWHGGFCLGPRLMLVAVPLLLLPLASAVARMIRDRRRASLLLFALVTAGSIVLQARLAAGDPFLFLHRGKLAERAAGRDPFEGDRIHLEDRFSPLLRAGDLPGGPFLFR